ncbi:MAG: SRPBCC domain-containing protein, partial [Bacteroidales bacterium]|nr:SRPBCC domain-containing protein [Bacteroidales bacterium]
NYKLSWLGHLFIPGLFDGLHYFKIEEVETNKVILEQGESFKGILAGMMMKSIGEQTRKGFVAMNNALKERVETLN